MKPWKRIEPTKVDKISHRTVVTKTFEMPNGQTASFGTMWPEGQEFVGVIALTPLNEVIIGKQFRVGPEMIMDDLPGGYVDDGETIEQAGVRELHEETGYVAGTVEYLGPSRGGYTNATWHCILATDCVYDPDDSHIHEAEEHVEVQLISINQLIDNAKQGTMSDAAGVLMAYDKLKELEGK